MEENHISEEPLFPEEKEMCFVCGREISVGEGRFRINEGVFCVNCYKTDIGVNGRHKKHKHKQKDAEDL